MKLIIVFATILVSVLAMTDENRTKLENMGKMCKEKSGATDEMMEKMRKREFMDDPKMRAFMLCMNREVGFMDERGEMMMDKIKERVKSAVTEMMEECMKKMDTPEETAFHMMKCLKTKFPNMTPLE